MLAAAGSFTANAIRGENQERRRDALLDASQPPNRILRVRTAIIVPTKAIGTSQRARPPQHRGQGRPRSWRASVQPLKGMFEAGAETPGEIVAVDVRVGVSEERNASRSAPEVA